LDVVGQRLPKFLEPFSPLAEEIHASKLGYKREQVLRRNPTGSQGKKSGVIDAFLVYYNTCGIVCKLGIKFRAYSMMVKGTAIDLVTHPVL
jgi:hypothetical protein